MANLATFQPYVDKENATAHPKNVDRSRIGLGGKVFQSNSHSLSTPRAVLKDVNQGLSGIRPGHEPGNKPLKAPVNPVFKKVAPLSSNPTPAKKKELKIHSNTSKKQKHAVTVQPDNKPIKKSEPLPPKENMHIYTDAEEVRPRMELDFKGVIDMFNKWRPPCWFGTRSDSDSEDETPEERQTRLLSDIDLPEMEVLSEPEMFTAEDLIDMPIPFIDEDLPIPFMDDSIDIEPNMGTLEIWDPISIPNTPEKNLNDST